MNRREFLRTTAVGAASLSTLPMPASGATSVDVSPKHEYERTVNRSRSRIAAYYFRAHMYTCVPRHIRDDMEWMADKGTNYVCPAFLEQDLFAAYENHAMIAEEAARVGMQVLAVPSRWGGLTAGAPKVPSLFSMLNQHTLIVNKRGSTGIGPKVAGGISSVHHPDTFRFFCDTLTEMYRQHPNLAGFVIDEPKCFIPDYSAMAISAMGKDAPLSAHYGAARDFFSRVCAFAKEKWPDKLTILFQQAHNEDDELNASSAVEHLDYFGVDGRPWGLEDDKKMASSEAGQESGKGKVLLSGRGEKFIRLARRIPGRKSFFLIENHNLHANMIEPMDRNYPAVLGLGADMVTYYYYPRNVADPDRAMEVIGRHLRAFAKTGS